jgi:shikimate kinase
MGTGKSSVGQLVAGQLHFAFLDTDQEIEDRVGKSINEIFSQEGEAAFRDCERKIVKELASRQRTVISTGGGLPVDPANLDSLRSHALVICLWASPEKIWERVRTQTHRPLLKDPDPLSKIRDLLAKREPAYRQADILINTEMRSVREVAQQILHQFQAALADSGVQNAGT